jgi:hypothetical protein
MVIPLDAYGPEFAGLVLAPDSGPVDNERAAETSWEPYDSESDMRDRGRVDGYSLWFQNTDPVNAGGAASGVFAVGSSVEAITGDSEASQYLRYDLEFAASAVGDEVLTYINLGAAESYPADGIGDESQGVIYRLDPTGNRSTWLTGVLFRRGDLVASVYVSRLDQADASAEAMRLAALLDQRIADGVRAAQASGPEESAEEPAAPGFSPPPPPDFALGSALGMRCSYASRFLRERYGLAPGKGCVILRITAGGAAEHAGIQIGDRVVSVDGVPVTSGRQFVAEILGYGEGPHQRWRIDRGGTQMTVDFWWGQPGTAPASDPYAEYLAGRDNAQEVIDIAHLSRAIHEEPGFDLAYLYRGQRRYELALRTDGDIAEARADIEEALRLDPDLQEAHEILAQMLSAIFLM